MRKKRREDATEFEFDGIDDMMFESVIKLFFVLKYIKIIFLFLKIYI
jgi:hypothetical protein